MLMRSGGLGSVAGLGQPIDPAVAVRFGAWTLPLVARGELWRLVTPIFLHLGLLHIIFNCLWLMQLGPLVERAYGRSRFLLIYLAGGVGGFAVSIAYRWQAHGPVPAMGAGASGTVFALIGVALVAGYVKKAPGAEVFRGGVARWALYAIVLSLLPGVDLAAHLGGGATGAVLGLALADRSQVRRLPDGVWLAVELLCLGVIAGSFALVALRPPG
jgi:rhomboid protease GluP